MLNRLRLTIIDIFFVKVRWSNIQFFLFCFVSVPYNYFKYMREFHDFLKQNPGIPSITLTYEDLHSHPVDNVKRLAKFIGVECTDEQAKNVMETCSFDNMKKAEIELKEKALYDKEEGKSQIFRKGSRNLFIRYGLIINLWFHFFSSIHSCTHVVDLGLNICLEFNWQQFIWAT